MSLLKKYSNQLYSNITEGSKSEREKQISYINAYMWNLKKLVQSYLQSRNRDIDVENKRMNTKGQRAGMG